MSNYKPDIEKGKFHPKYLERIDEETGELVKGKPLYVFKPENIGEQMSIDDKSIGHEGFTILSNGQTSRIALMIESCKSEEVAEALSLFGKDLRKIKSISCDMSASYLKVCKEELPQANVVIDKFHVMQYVYDAVLDVRTNQKKELSSSLSKGKLKTEKDKEIMEKLGMLKHCRYRLTQSENKWSETGKELMEKVFDNHPKLKTAYKLSQSFKRWYGIDNHCKQKTQIIKELHQWYWSALNAGIDEFKSSVKMIRKHECEIVNFFICGQTNARAERLNGKINRFLSNSFGMKDRDFALYRTALYFA